MGVFIEKKLTVRAFQALDVFEENYLYELLDGEIVKRSSPDTPHQNASANLLRILFEHIPGKSPGRIFHAPFDVVLSENNMVQPDLIFISAANSGIVKEGCIEGVPDLLVEILSPGTFKTDRGLKFRLYRQAGVAEYWIVDPRSRSIEVYILNEGDYELMWSGLDGEEVESKVLAGLKVSVDEVFS